MRIYIDESIKYQVFEGFGASGAWWAQELGSWTHHFENDELSVRDRVSKLLFDKQDGIALRTYRYNIGAGSKGGKDNISNPLRRTESFYTDKGLDFSKDENAVYMMRRATMDGADEIVLFVNSPIVQLTKNGLSHLKKHQIMRENLPKRNYDAFAAYCLDIAENFINEGLPIKYISPINEPVWIWNGGQEGCHYSPKSAAAVMKAFAKALNKRPLLNSVSLSGIESGDLRWLNKSYTRYLLSSKEVRQRLDSVDVHSYCLPLPFPLCFLNNRLKFVKRYSRWHKQHYPDLPIKMSEWCHMQGGRDKTMASALVMANTIFEDIFYLNVTSWQHWIAVSEVDYCDGLIYINLSDKSYELTKRYFVTGNFSKYIPFGAQRVFISCPDKSIKLLCFVKDGKKTVIAINDKESPAQIILPIPSGRECLAVLTDEFNNLTEIILKQQDFCLPAFSVCTFVF